MNIEIFKAMLVNIGLLILLAQVLARIKAVRRIIVYENESIKDQLLLIIIFSSIGIISNYTGYAISGAIANTRVIGVMASSFIGGPLVGIVTGTIAGIHRFIIDISGFSTIACTISTFLGGLIGAMVSRHIKENKYNSSELFLITFVVESLQMLIILLISRPFDEAFLLVKNIFLPMTIFNSIGMVLFVGVFKNIITEQEQKIGKKVNLTFEITHKCLPILQTGEYNEKNCNNIGEIILDFSNDLAVVITNTEEIISINGDINLLPNKNPLPDITQLVFEKKEVIVAENAKEEDIFYEPLKHMIAIAVPLIKSNKVFGSMIIFSKKYRISYDSQILFADGLGKLLSTQYELADMERQKGLLVKAEYKALQSQINPHFIFNSLNTISSFVREKPNEARELLIALATYFRNSIKTKDALVSIYEEMEYVKAFLQLVKARFDERLEISIKLPEGLDCKVPCLIVQPIVENAVFHGAMSKNIGKVDIEVRERERDFLISVSDNGHGISDDIIQGLKNNTTGHNNIGLSNVHKRLCYMYGSSNGLDIVSTPSGTRVNISIVKN
ncbi:LytS/YhcK type 5TM receptor domain-containing protein [Tissierella sp.]|uniref:LytS/YhcK type 5TM receptor domain-containing protein n=1 Tax=Tissierella sp. TaxID=41274 RepID=UPI002854406B|nr:LytS/YhcK type 5TM receptor domain-containing protein [Tissierella sp.]MDR7857514.1 LytS/YhcK type 5TM receptor domain-containing protein [Tissierella sp.]